LATESPEIEIPPVKKGIAIISQTTKSPARFAQFAQAIAGRFTGKVPEIRIVDTTCPETGRRYQAAEELASSVDVIFVVGSRSSANRASGLPTHHIESAGEIEVEWLKEGGRFGVTAGASTPDGVIEAVIRRLREFERMKKGQGIGGKYG